MRFQDRKGRDGREMTVRMVLGTGSGVGKSLLVAGICRFAARQGMRVRPFKSQNMSNNSAALREGGEIARAQALQARGSWAEPSSLMNPVLLKPMGEGRSQVIFMGHPLGLFSIAEYRDLKKELFPKVLEAFHELSREADLVVIEGAGSPAEINLLSEDIANTRLARELSAPALLVGDIEPGGVFASLYGTLALLPPDDRAVIRWLAINKFRGEAALLDSGMEQISQMTGRPFLGVVPHLGSLALPDEDSFQVRAGTKGLDETDDDPLRLVAVEWPHLSNRSDLDCFLSDRGVSLTVVSLAEPFPPLSGAARPEALILPGSRRTIADLEALYGSPFHSWLLEYQRSGGVIVGICGGYQMMGRRVLDPAGVESSRSEIPGLGFFSHEVVFREAKIARRVRARFRRSPFRGGERLVDHTLSGYEIRQGWSDSQGGEALFDLFDPEDGRFLESEGRCDPDRNLFGSPIHGLFDDRTFRHAFYDRLRPGRIPFQDLADSGEEIDRALDRVAETLSRSLDLESFLFREPPPAMTIAPKGDPFAGR